MSVLEEVAREIAKLPEDQIRQEISNFAMSAFVESETEEEFIFALDFNARLISRVRELRCTDCRTVRYHEICQ